MTLASGGVALGVNDSKDGIPCQYAGLGILFKCEEAAQSCWTRLARKSEQAARLATW